MLYPHGNDRIIHSNERDGPPARSAQTAQSLREGELRRLRGRANLDCLTLLWRHAYADHRIKPKQRAAPGSPPSAPRMPCITLARRGLGGRGITHECRHLASLPSAGERWSCSRQPGRGHGSAACPRPRFQPPAADRARPGCAGGGGARGDEGGRSDDRDRPRADYGGGKKGADRWRRRAAQAAAGEADRDKATVRASSARRQQLDR